MENLEYQAALIDALVIHEELMGELYQRYAEKFHDHEEFWKRISADEIKHAGLLDTLKIHIDSGKGLFEKGAFHLPAIKTSTDFIRRQISEAFNKQVTLINALSIAMDFENSLIEKNYYQVAAGGSAELNKMIAYIIDDEKRHRDMIKEMWQQCRSC